MLDKSQLWMHGSLGLLILGVGKWIVKHVKEIKMRLNGHTIEYKDK